MAAGNAKAKLNYVPVVVGMKGLPDMSVELQPQTVLPVGRIRLCSPRIVVIHLSLCHPSLENAV